MSPRDAPEWVSRGRALEDELGRLRGERARTSRGCGGASAGQGDIGARGGLDVGCRVHFCYPYGMIGLRIGGIGMIGMMHFGLRHDPRHALHCRGRVVVRGDRIDGKIKDTVWRWV